MSNFDCSKEIESGIRVRTSWSVGMAISVILIVLAIAYIYNIKALAQDSSKIISGGINAIFTVLVTLVIGCFYNTLQVGILKNQVKHLKDRITKIDSKEEEDRIRESCENLRERLNKFIK